MFGRTLGYILGAAAAAALASWLGRIEGFESIKAWLAALIFAAIVLTHELAKAVSQARRASQIDMEVSDEPTPKGPEKVGLASMLAVRKAENLRDSRFQKFQGREECADPNRFPRGVSRGDRRSPPLRGDFVIVSLFLGADGRSWSESEIVMRLSSLESAARWLIGEASRWRIRIHMSLSDTYFESEHMGEEAFEIGFAEEGDGVGPVEVDAGQKALVMMSRAARSLGFEDAPDLIARVDGFFGGKKSIWFLHLRRAGRSIALPRDLSELEGVSLAFCYAREASFTGPTLLVPAPDPTTFAHELLHLFGATDKYGKPLDSFPPGMVTRSEIMRLDRGRLRELQIDPLTAAEIGWGTGRLPEARFRSSGKRPPD